MCNLYRLRKGPAEVARLFAASPEPGLNTATEVYPGYRGLVVADRHVQAMHWGFPVLLKGKQGQPLRPKPVTNARQDKLLTPFWRDSFIHRRCLIPVTSWAEPSGSPGRMTRSWYGLPRNDCFAVAGLWRESLEWGAVYAMVMVEASAKMAKVHDRMPVLLRRADLTVWQNGTAAEARSLCRTWTGVLTAEHTSDSWTTGLPLTQQLPF